MNDYLLFKVAADNGWFDCSKDYHSKPGMFWMHFKHGVITKQSLNNLYDLFELCDQIPCICLEEP